MTSERYLESETITYGGRFENSLGVPITNATGVIKIRRVSNNQFFNGTTFQTAVTTVAMTEIDEVNAPGEWTFDFDSSLGNTTDKYVVDIIDQSGNADNELETQFSIVGNYLDVVDDKIDIIDTNLDALIITTDSIETKIDIIDTNIDDIINTLTAITADTARILGLSHENFVMEPTSFNTDDQILTGEVRWYDTAANATTDDGSTGLLGSQTYTSPRSDGLLIKMTQIKVS